MQLFTTSTSFALRTRPIVYFRTLVTLRRVRVTVRVGLELRLGLG